MKKTQTIFELLSEKTENKKIIQLTHCLQIPSCNMFETSININPELDYVLLGKHGKYDKILAIRKNNETIFYLGHWNDGVLI